MFISGPRASALGCEQGTTACRLLVGQGGDHLTSSMIYHDSATTCIPNTLAGGVGCFSGAVCAQGASFSGKTNIVKSHSDYAFTVVNTDSNGYGMYIQAGNTNNAIDVYNAAGTTQTLKLTGAGVACFSNTVCAPTFVGGNVSGTAIYGSSVVCGGSVCTSGVNVTNSIYFGGVIESGGLGSRLWVPGQAIGQASNAGLYAMALTYLAKYSGGWKSVGGGYC